MKKTFLLSLVTFITATFSFAQNVGINKDGSRPDSSAMLDLKNPNKGILIPRVALTGTADVTTIPSPATSLMVYNTRAAGSGTTAVGAGYYYWNGTAWVRLVSSTTATNISFKTLIPYASGTTVTLSTAPTGFVTSIALIGFGSSQIRASEGGGTLFATGISSAFTVPSSGVITDISGLFSSFSSSSITSDIFIKCQLFISTGNNSFTPLTSAVVTLSPGYSSTVTTSTVSTGTISGLNIPVVAGSHILMVVSASNSFGEISNLTGYFSGGVNMIIQ